MKNMRIISSYIGDEDKRILQRDYTLVFSSKGKQQTIITRKTFYTDRQEYKIISGKSIFDSLSDSEKTEIDAYVNNLKE